MAATPMNLAICSGPIVTTWDCHSDAGQANIIPYDDNHFPVVDVSWNTSGQVLASCLAVADDKDNILLTSTSHNSLLDSFRHDAGLKRPSSFAPKNNKHATASCISFGVKSRYILVGDDCGAVCLWDLKKKSRVRHYFHSGASLQTTLDPTDINVLSLAESALHIFRLREGALAATMTGTSRFAKFTTSSLEPRNVAIGTRIGTLELHDVSVQSKILSMSPHTGSVTGLQFSHVNKLLLASASVDETLAFSDITIGKVVQHVTLKSPATSMSFHNDGRTCAVGTESGRVLVYDSRKPKEVIASLSMKNRVTAVSFAPGDDANVAATKPRRSTLSSTDSTEYPTSSVQQVGRLVDSVLNRSRDSSNAASISKENKQPTATMTALDNNAIREIVRQELDLVRDEMEEAMRNLQVDMCRKFMKQAQEYDELVSRLQEENDDLRQENEFLRTHR